jgi:S-DNA-T family DNA segregation ATPase FtsK/SpoIIIE
MAKRKKKKQSKNSKSNKEKKDQTQEQSSDSFWENIDPNIKKTILAIIFLTLTVALAFTLFNGAGQLGEVLNDFLSKILGVVRYFLPVGSLVLAFMYFKRLEKKNYFSLWLGLILIIIGVLGLFHIFYPQDELKEIANQGDGGGMTGYLIASTLLKILGKYVGTFLLIAFVSIGALLTFNSYFAKLFKNLEENNGLTKKKDLKINQGHEGEEKEEPKEEKVKIKTEKEPFFSKMKILFNSLFSKVKPSAENQPLESNDPGQSKQAITNEEQSKPAEENNKPEEKEKKVKFTPNINQNSAPNLNQNPSANPGLDPNNPGMAIKNQPILEREWNFPPLSLLNGNSSKPEAGDIENNSAIIEEALRNFGITAEVIEVNVGPTVTQYAVKPAQGMRLSKIVALQNDLSMALAAHPLRIEAPIPGKSLVGIEIPNKKFATVRLRNLLESEEFQNRDGLVIALGEDSAGNYICADIKDMPHLLIAGATGAGKSIGIADVVNSLLYKHSPEDLRLILIDPKRVELSVYNDIPHLLTPVIVDNDKVVNSLKWAVNEMERRYKVLQEAGTRDLDSYNEYFKKLKEKEEKEKAKNPREVNQAQNANPNFSKERPIMVKTMDGIGYVKKAPQAPVEVKKSPEPEREKLPYIVIIIDEMADIMVTHGKEVETLIVRIAQKARAVGIHLILSTQRPSVQIITGIIKANIPARIAYQVASQIDSRTILDMAGAEKLLGKGDMLFMARDNGQPTRIQGAFIEENEVKKVSNHLKKQSDPDYNEEITQKNEVPDLEKQINANGGSSGGGDGEYEDDLFESSRDTVLEFKKASATFLQRKLRIGYARAARLIEMLEEKGIIGPAQGSKPREILINSLEENNPPEA